MKTDNVLDAFRLIFKYRFPQWNIYISLVFVILSAVFIILLFRSQISIKKKIYCGLLYVYSYNVLVSTLFMRQIAKDRMYNLVPFSEFYNLICEPHKSASWEVVFNIILFMPIGLLLPCIIKKKKFKITLLTGFCSTLLIEIIQVLAKIGEFETDDIIANTLGTITGFGAYKAIHHIKTAIQTKNTNQS